jgi:copper(I)-binding protein
MRRVVAAAMLTLGAAGSLPGCAGAGAAELSARRAAVGAGPGTSAALYVELTNDGGQDDSLVDASCACAAATSLHVTEDRGGILVMSGADELAIPAGGTLQLDPGRSHVMLEELAEPLEVGDRVEVRLEFERSEDITLEVPVVAPEELAERVGEVG